jgi:hypothetical protein
VSMLILASPDHRLSHGRMRDTGLVAHTKQHLRVGSELR